VSAPHPAPRRLASATSEVVVEIEAKNLLVLDALQSANAFRPPGAILLPPGANTADILRRTRAPHRGGGRSRRPPHAADRAAGGRSAACHSAPARRAAPASRSTAGLAGRRLAPGRYQLTLRAFDRRGELAEPCRPVVVRVTR
jgi:hypothetical protein